jgi:hypothetical protein
MLATASVILALAPAAHAAFSAPSKFPTEYKEPSTKPAGYVTTTKKYESSVKCKAVATTYNFQASQSAHVTAGV